MRSHFHNSYDSKNSNDFQEKLFKDLSEEMFIFKISSDNHFRKLSIYKAFELPDNLISNTILPLFYSRIYKEDRIKVLRLFIQLKKTEEKAEIEFRCLLPKKGLYEFKAYIKTKLDAKGCTAFYVTFFKTTPIVNKELFPNNLEPKIITTNKKELKLIQTIKLYSEHNNRLLNFTHITSHNLNTHSGNIKQLLDLIETEKNVQLRKEYLNHLRTVSNDLNETIAHLSQIINIQNNLNVIKEPLDLNSYLEKTRKLINNYGLENKVTIINKVPKGSIINFNSAYLESVLLNFSTNAVKYAHPNRFPVITFDFFIENQKKVLTINDNGLGIDLEKHGNLLFGMYKTFHKHENANGIGLYITKNQIESMKGQINVESKVNEGTTFKIIFND
ncbi:HAMP domain-containing histidine kinase [Flavobacterium sufflavum]|uniref:histidine kinase n=1 Tax=Flavobacterium sufflavum TaxID=1921138 RepID=A0A3S2U7P6_9FLAO|nr:HAMP domain-containing sensor histidine kinase [Flavobacterium sufflavum]RVT78210.1 HAMP domain-containing histidine kinase [Flavobacterium sufflavum]